MLRPDCCLFCIYFIENICLPEYMTTVGGQFVLVIGKCRNFCSSYSIATYTHFVPPSSAIRNHISVTTPTELSFKHSHLWQLSDGVSSRSAAARRKTCTDTNISTRLLLRKKCNKIRDLLICSCSSAKEAYA